MFVVLSKRKLPKLVDISNNEMVLRWGLNQIRIFFKDGCPALVKVCRLQV
jgi:hypothetical protein